MQACHHCEADVHCCLNCEHYDTGATTTAVSPRRSTSPIARRETCGHFGCSPVPARETRRKRRDSALEACSSSPLAKLADAAWAVLAPGLSTHLVVDVLEHLPVAFRATHRTCAVLEEAASARREAPVQVAAAPDGAGAVAQARSDGLFISKRMPLFVGLGAMIDHGVMGKNPARRSVGHLDLSTAKSRSYGLPELCPRSRPPGRRSLSAPRGRQQAPVRKGFFEAARTLTVWV